jgi:hypothetical protein
MSVQVKDRRTEAKAPEPSNVCSGWCTTFAETVLYSLVDSKIPAPQQFTICRTLSGKQYYCYEVGGARYEVGKRVEGDKTVLILCKKLRFCVYILLNRDNEVEEILLTRFGSELFEYQVARLLPKEGKLILMYEHWTKIMHQKKLVVEKKEFNANDTCILAPCSPEKMPSWAQKPIRIRDITEKLIQVARVALAIYGIPAKL